MFVHVVICVCVHLRACACGVFCVLQAPKHVLRCVYTHTAYTQREVCRALYVVCAMLGIASVSA